MLEEALVVRADDDEVGALVLGGPLDRLHGLAEHDLDLGVPWCLGGRDGLGLGLLTLEGQA
jgi:hypothetical protein